MSRPTDEQLNLAILEWMGWYDYIDADIKTRWKNRCSDEDVGSKPDYISDDSPRRLLNDAEAKLNREHGPMAWLDYTDILRKACGIEQACASVSASARQRVIAILQVVKPDMFK